MCKVTQTIQANHKQDLNAAKERLQKLMAKLVSSINTDDYPKVCASLRAINEETANMLHTSRMLTLDPKVKVNPRFTERGQCK